MAKGKREREAVEALKTAAVAEFAGQAVTKSFQVICGVKNLKFLLESMTSDIRDNKCNPREYLKAYYAVWHTLFYASEELQELLESKRD